MAEIVKETVVTRSDTDKPTVVKQTKVAATGSQTAQYTVYFLFGVLEILLGFRLVLKLLGASQASMFVRIIYSLTSLFVAPFEGIFHKAVTQGIETVAVLEPSTIVAMLVYAVLAWIILMLVGILSGEKQPEE
ncbi:MAG TPA: YggT family protein [Patescibacteria group bacterium]|nr:YggT family protein [Patescibacteria group bacterium]